MEMFVDHKHVLFCIIQKRKEEDMPIHICLVFIFADYRADFSFNSDIGPEEEVKVHRTLD